MYSPECFETERGIVMKKLVAFVLLLVIGITCVSCGGSGDPYQSACDQLAKTSMGGTEYTQTQIDELEARFTKMNLSAGFSRVNHFRSTTEYAYVIEFENVDDAQIFFDRIGTGSYNVKKLGGVVVYGKSASIDGLE